MFAVLFADHAPMLELAKDLHMSLRRSPTDNAVVEAWRTL